MNPYDSISDLSKVWGTATITTSCNCDKMENVNEDFEESQCSVDQLEEYLPEPSLENGDNYKCANWCAQQNTKLLA